MTLQTDIDALVARLPATPEDAPWILASWLDRITVDHAPGDCRVYGRVLLGPCWLWHGATNGKGHGRVFFGGQKNKRGVYLHRYALASFLGCDHTALDNVDHLCRRRNCFQPLHLESVTHLENYQRGDGPTYQFQPQQQEPELSQDDLAALIEGF